MTNLDDSKGTFGSFRKVQGQISPFSVLSLYTQTIFKIEATQPLISQDHWDKY